jgi:DNA polymerase I-like protein with 3'-5' exonuclease and polymerase domains
LSFQQCCNLPVQGICADAMPRAIALVHTRFAAAGIRGGLVANVHDEPLNEVVDSDAESAREILRKRWWTRLWRHSRARRPTT